MAKRYVLKNMSLDEISLVDRGANAGAKVVLAKRATEVDKMIKEENGKFCVYSADGSKKLGEHDTKDEAAKQLAAIEANKREDVMPKLDISKLDPAVQDHIAALEKKAAEAATKEAEAVAKAAAKDADEKIAKAQAEAAEKVAKAEATAKEAVELAKAEREARLLREYTEKVGVFKRLPIDKSKDGAVLREVDEKCSPEVAKRIAEILKAADAAMVEAGVLMTQIGSSQEGTGNANDQLMAMAKKAFSEGKAASIAKGYAAAMEAHPELAQQAQREAIGH